jgi:predicted NAD-dependent protein-ADP-ribosyltransferase YbiA (DUF1768 family)
MSDYVQKSYSEKRVEELKKELDADKSQTVDKAWKAVFDMKDTTQSNNFKMGSRQACNFAFPPEVSRPRAGNKKEELAEALAGMETEELLTLGEDIPAGTEEFPELAEEEAEVEVEETVQAPPKQAVPKQAAQLNIKEFGSTLQNEYTPFSRSIVAPLLITEAGTETTYQSLDEYFAKTKAAYKPPEWQKTVTRVQRDLKKSHISTMIQEAPISSLYNFLITKYQTDKALSELLLSTGDAPLVEVEQSGDPFWANNLFGKLLMQVRKELRELDEMPRLEGGGKTLAELRAEIAAKKAAAPESKEDSETEGISAECKVGRKLGEDMATAVKRATECFRNMDIAGKRLLLGVENGLDTYSPKYVAMLERIAAAPGSSLVYSTFLNLEGIGLFRVAMTNNGYAPIDMILSAGQLAFTPETEKSLRLGPGKQPRFLTFSGAEDEQVRAAALSIFNAQFSDLPESMGKILTESGYTDNKVGELCRVFCITSAGAEGLSLRNVRAVHIMEPYWNEVRVRQVKGRAIRIGSHLDLAPEDRNVSIYTYVSVFSDEAQTNTGGERIIETIANHDDVDVQVAKEMGILTDERIKQLSEKLKGKKMTTYITTTDEFFYSISERKRRVIEAIECILKSSAIDCEINYRKNKDSTFMCLPLKGKIGEYVYNPDLEIDVLNMPQFSGIDVEKTCTGLDISTALTKPKAAAAAAITVKDIFKALKGVTYRMRPVMSASGEIERFDMYEADQAQPTKVIPEKLLGTAGVKDGKPAPPVKML